MNGCHFEGLDRDFDRTFEQSFPKIPTQKKTINYETTNMVSLEYLTINYFSGFYEM